MKSFTKVITNKRERAVFEINTEIRHLICLQDNNDSYHHSIWEAPYWEISVWVENPKGEWYKKDHFWSTLVRRSDGSEFVREAKKIEFWGEKYPEISKALSVDGANREDWKEGKILFSYL